MVTKIKVRVYHLSDGAAILVIERGETHTFHYCDKPLHPVQMKLF